MNSGYEIAMQTNRAPAQQATQLTTYEYNMASVK